ncbi:MAG: nucleotidyltransferase family protein [bacterium]
MNREKIEQKLKKLKPVLKEKYKVKSIGFFGSYSRQEAIEDSDIDILVEFSESIGWEFIDIKNFLEEKLGKKVDLVTPEALRPEFKEDVLKDVIYQ